MRLRLGKALVCTGCAGCAGWKGHWEFSSSRRFMPPTRSLLLAVTVTCRVGISAHVLHPVCEALGLAAERCLPQATEEKLNFALGRRGVGLVFAPAGTERIGTATG